MKVWIEARGFPNYEASNEGDIRNKKTGRILHQYEGTAGYMRLSLRKDGQQVQVRVHRLVADSFCDGDHEGMDVNHIDGNKQNNHIANLEFCSRKENIQHAFNTGLKKPSRQMRIRVVETGEIYDSIRDCKRATGFDHSAISKCLSGKQDNYKGYHFEKY